MGDIDLIFRIAAIGVIAAILNTLLARIGRDELAHLTTIVTVTIVMIWVVRLVRELFDTVRTMFRM